MANETCPIPEPRTQAVLVADMANGGTEGQGDPASVRRIAREVAAANGGRFFDASGESVFALYENALDAVGAALAVQAKLKKPAQAGSQLRIGVHVGQVLFQDGRPFGETLIIGALLESLAEPGDVLVSAEVKDAVALQLAATFEARGLQAFAQISRRIATFRVRTAESSSAPADSPDPTLNETLLDQLPDAAQQTSSLRPRDDNAGKAVSEATPSSAGALDATMNITMLDQPPGLNRATPNDRRSGAGTGRGQASTPQGSVAVLTGAPAPAPQAARLDETVLILPEGGALAPSVPPLSPGPWRDPLTRVLATRIGPIAPIIVNREAASVATLAELIERLAETIPSSRERVEFRAEAARLLPRSES